MIHKRISICEKCNEMFFDETACLEHEAQHYGLTLDEYEQWEILTENAANAGKYVSITKNEDTDVIFDKACEELTKFEQEHHLGNMTYHPSHFI